MSSKSSASSTNNATSSSLLVDKTSSSLRSNVVNQKGGGVGGKALVKTQPQDESDENNNYHDLKSHQTYQLEDRLLSSNEILSKHLVSGSSELSQHGGGGTSGSNGGGGGILVPIMNCTLIDQNCIEAAGASNSTTTINLSESNSHQNIYFMMQTPLDILQSTGNNTMSKLKVSPSSIQAVKASTTASLMPAVTTHQADQLSINTITLTTNSSTPSPPSSSTGSNRVVRDERRRANHNEVERRRRDNINKWIVELSKVIPDCSNDQSKHGQSKGGILEKTVLYLNSIKSVNQKLGEQVKSLEKIRAENELLRQQNELLRNENSQLKVQLLKEDKATVGSSNQVTSSSSPSSSDSVSELQKL